VLAWLSVWSEVGVDFHVVQLMPLPLTASCFSKIQIGFTFLVPAHPGSPGKRAVKRVCVCVRQTSHEASRLVLAFIFIFELQYLSLYWCVSALVLLGLISSVLQ